MLIASTAPFTLDQREYMSRASVASAAEIFYKSRIRRCSSSPERVRLMVRKASAIHSRKACSSKQGLPEGVCRFGKCSRRFWSPSGSKALTTASIICNDTASSSRFSSWVFKFWWCGPMLELMIVSRTVASDGQFFCASAITLMA